MEIKNVTREEFDLSIKEVPSSYLQKSSWGDLKSFFNEYSPLFYTIIQDQHTIGAFMILERTVKKFFITIKIPYIPRTTFFFKQEDQANTSLLQELLTTIKNTFSFVLFELDFPFWNTALSANEQWLQQRNAILSENTLEIKKYIQPHTTFIKQLENKDILASIPSSNARRNIKRGAKKLEDNGIVFEVLSELSQSDLTNAYDLITEVSAEKGFNRRSIEYFSQLQRQPGAVWFVFRDQDHKIVLANLGIINHLTSSYSDLYVGRKLKYDNFYISYVLKFESFKYLQSQQITYYDHWGIDTDPGSYMYKFTVFKQHFGGDIILYPYPHIATNQAIVKMVIFLIKLVRYT